MSLRQRLQASYATILYAAGLVIESLRHISHAARRRPGKCMHCDTIRIHEAMEEERLRMERARKREWDKVIQRQEIEAAIQSTASRSGPFRVATRRGVN